MMEQLSILNENEKVYWIITNDKDPRAIALADRHYSRKTPKSKKGFMGPGEQIVLISPDGTAIFGWLKAKPEFRGDKIDGVYCSIFRNEGPELSSKLILEAEKFALQKWPDTKLFFTYVDPSKVRSKRPGWAFIKAGWKEAGTNKNGKLLLLTKEIKKGGSENDK